MGVSTAHIDDLFCTVCGAHFPIMRRASKKKSDTHVKHLWCCTCKERTQHMVEKDTRRGNSG